MLQVSALLKPYVKEQPSKPEICHYVRKAWTVGTAKSALHWSRLL